MLQTEEQLEQASDVVLRETLRCQRGRIDKLEAELDDPLSPFTWQAFATYAVVAGAFRLIEVIAD